jgi:hypothetical protein
MYLITMFVKSFYYWENNIKHLIGLNTSCYKFDLYSWRSHSKTSCGLHRITLQAAYLLLETPDLLHPPPPPNTP